jgi:hypothetical protein
MSNVMNGGGGGTVPEIYKGEGHPGECKYPPETIESEVSRAGGKAKMNFKHPPLGPEQHYIDSEEGGAKEPAAEGDEKKPKHRATSGIPGHTLTGN